jgi:hypothetical protein
MSQSSTMFRAAQLLGVIFLTTVVGWASLALLRDKPDSGAAPRAGEQTQDDATNGKDSMTSTQDAHSLAVGLAKPSDGFLAEDIEVMESLPPQFALRVQSKVSLPLVLDELIPMSKTGVFIAKVRYQTPGKDQNVQPSGVRVAFGALKVGKYSLEVHLSPAPGEPHAKVQTFELTAQ